MKRKLIHDDGGVRDLIYVDMAELNGIADYCKARQNEGLTGPLIEKYLNDTGITFAEWMKNPVHVRRMLRDPALAHFRINKMDVGK